jgi:CBS-domain-containing membrane protein
MKIGSGLALICVGAILAFAVTANISGFNIHIAGWVLIIIGIIGLALTSRNYGWVNRRVVRRTYPSRVQPTSYAASPGTQAIEPGQPTRPTLLDQDNDLIEPTATHRPTTEVVEDLYEQP